MSERPLVSVCLPIFDGGEPLVEALASLRRSDYRPIEVVVSDDGSRDESLRRVREAGLDEGGAVEVRISSHARLGLVGNWNHCVSLSRGKYVKFLFQDDLLEPACISRMVELAETSERIGMVFSRRRLIAPPGDDIARRIADVHRGWTALRRTQPGLDLLSDPRLMDHPHNKVGEPTCVLVRREVFDALGGFDPAFAQYGDLEMWLRIMAHHDVGFLDEPLASFRIHERQTTQRNMARDELWSEIHRLFLKLLTDPAYDTIPARVRRRLRRRLVRELLAEAVRPPLPRSVGRTPEIARLIGRTLQSALR